MRLLPKKYIKTIALSLFFLFFGAYLGAELAIKFGIKYSKGLSDYYISSRITSIMRTTITIKKAEEKVLDEIIHDNAIFLRASFFQLAHLHKSGSYLDKDKKIIKSLKMAEKCINERKSVFNPSKDKQLNDALTYVSNIE